MRKSGAHPPAPADQQPDKEAVVTRGAAGGRMTSGGSETDAPSDAFPFHIFLFRLRPAQVWRTPLFSSHYCSIIRCNLLVQKVLYAIIRRDIS